MKMLKRTWAEIDLDALRHNYKTLTRNLPEGCRFLGVVKADAYGHGAVPVARELQALGAGYLAVSNYEEALQLRRADVSLPILILGYTPVEFAVESRAAHHPGSTFSGIWQGTISGAGGQRTDPDGAYEDRHGDEPPGILCL